MSTILPVFLELVIHVFSLVLPGKKVGLSSQSRLPRVTEPCLNPSLAIIY